jgi:hypothetical protein
MKKLDYEGFHEILPFYRKFSGRSVFNPLSHKMSTLDIVLLFLPGVIGPGRKTIQGSSLPER